jgi:hypothetical protein
VKASSNLSKDQARSMEKELAVLTRLQYEALQRSSYLRMSQSEAEEYDKRRLTIGELCELLAKYKSDNS